MKLTRYALAILFVISLIATTAAQDSPTAQDILDRSEDQLKGRSSSGTYTMKVITPDYTRSFSMESHWVEENDKALIKVLAPKREAGNKTLKIGNEIWMYLRNTETTIKIPPSMMLQSWNGSDYTFDDLVRESNIKTDYRVSIADEVMIEDEPCWKLLLAPRPDAPVVWGKIHYWVRKQDYLPAKIQFFDEKNTLIRSQVFNDFRETGGRKLPLAWIMINELKPGHKTVMVLDDVKFDIDIADRVFSFQALER